MQQFDGEFVPDFGTATEKARRLSLVLRTKKL